MLQTAPLKKGKIITKVGIEWALKSVYMGLTALEPNFVAFYQNSQYHPKIINLYTI